MTQTRRRRRTRPETLRAVSYRRVSTREQGDTRLGLDAQTEKVAAAIEYAGWNHVADFHDVSTGKSRNGRSGLEAALVLLDNGEADVLVVAKLDRLARSVVDFGGIVRHSMRQDWALKVLDLDVDTTTASGRLCANLVAAIAEWEGDTISERTKAALAQLKDRGVRLGNAPTIPPATERKVLKAYESEGSYLGAARRLNEAG